MEKKFKFIRRDGERKLIRRARTHSKKEKKYFQILSTGRKLFMSHGIEGFSMRALARQLTMSKGNLYNYVKSKRELWFGIVTLEYEKFQEKLEKIISDHKGKHIPLLVEIGSFFLKFCAKDYRRFQMMFLTPPPKSEVRGPIEEEFKYNNLLGFVREIFLGAIEAKEIKSQNADSMTLYYWGTILGAAKVEANLEPMNYFMSTFFENNKSYSREDFRKFYLEKTAENLRRL